MATDYSLNYFLVIVCKQTGVQIVCLFAWYLTALSAQIGYIMP